MRSRQPSAEPSPRPWPRRSFILLVALAAVLPFLPSIGGEFVSDDVRFVAENGALEDPSILGRAFTDPTTVSSGREGPDWRGIYRPLRTLGFALDRALGGGATWVFHLHALLWHALASVLVLLLLVRLLDPGLPALLGALVFAVHPAQVESVAWISSRGDVMAGALTLAALLLAMRGTRRAVLAASAVLVLALLSKESAIVAPALLVLLVRGGGRRPAKASGLAALSFIGLAVLYFLWRSHVLEGAGDETLGHRAAWWGGSWLGAWLTMARGAVHYLQILVVPTNLMLDTHVPQPEAGSVPADAVILLIAIVLFVAGAARAWWRGRSWGLGVLWIVVALAPVANVLVTVNIPTAQRFLYLSMAGWALLVAVAVRRLAAVRPARWLVPATAALVLLLAAISFDRAGDWRTEERLWSVSLHDPATGHDHGTVTSVEAPRFFAALAYENGDGILARGGDPDDAAARFEDCRRLARAADRAAVVYTGYAGGHTHPRAAQRVALAEFRLARDCGRDLWLEALKSAETAAEAAAGRYAPGFSVVGRICAELGLLGPAAAAFEQAAALAPTEPAYRHNLVLMLNRLVRERIREDRPRSITEALDLLERSLAVDPDPVSNADAHALRGALARAHGSAVTAAVEASRARGEPPAESLAVARAHAHFGRFDEARKILARVARTHRGAPAVAVEAAVILHLWRDRPEDLGEALSILEGLERAKQLPPFGYLALARCADRFAELAVRAGRARDATAFARRGMRSVVRSMETPDFTGLALQGALFLRLAEGARLADDPAAAERAFGKAVGALTGALERKDVPDSPAKVRAHRLLARALEALGASAEAAAQLEIVRVSEPTPADAPYLAVRIRRLIGAPAR